jgi:hypothetical protein
MSRLFDAVKVQPCRWLGLLCWFGISWVPLHSTVAGAQDHDSLVSRIPGNVLFAIEMEHPREVATAFNDTQLGQVLSGESWQPFQHTMRDKNRASAIYIEPIFGLGWTDLVELNLPTAIIGLNLGNKSAADDTGLILAVNQAEVKQTIIGKCGEYFEKHQGVPTEYRRGNVTGRLISSKVNGVKREVVLLDCNGCVAILTSQAAANAWIDFLQQDGKSASLNLGVNAENANAAQAVLRFVIQPEPILTRLLGGKKGQGPEGDSQRFLASLRRQGFAQLKQVIGQVDLSVGSSTELTIRWEFVYDAPWKKGMRLLALTPKSLGVPPLWIDESVERWSVYSRNIDAWFAGIGDWFDDRVDPEFPGAFADVIEGLASDPEGPQIRVKEEIVSRFTGLTSSIAMGSGADEQQDSERIFTVEVTDSERLAKVFDRYFEGDDIIQQGSQDSVRFWYTQGEPLFMASGEDSEEGMTAMALLPGTLMLAAQWSTIESLLRNLEPESALANSQRFKDAESIVGGMESPANAGMSMTMAEKYLARAYAGLTQYDPSETIKSPLTELLGYLLVGSDWKKQPALIASLPQYNQAWFARWGDLVTGIHTSDARMQGSTFLLLRK